MPTTTSILVTMTAAVALAACSRDRSRTSAGTLDTATADLTAVTPAVGPGVQVTRTDGKSVTRAMRYELTADNFGRFLAAADSLAALAARDSATRSYLAMDIVGAGSTDPDAGLKWLESNDAVNGAISSAGISTKDYFVQSIAIAAASRFVADPKSAPPTPTLAKNAEFLRTRPADLARLDAERSGKTVLTATP